MRFSAKFALLALTMAATAPAPAVAGDMLAYGASFQWWAWPLALFVVTFLIGIVAVLAGIGGGVLFVSIVSSVFPFHLDFVRSTGLLLALAGALSAGPGLLNSGVASLRLALPFALIGSVFSMAGALASFAVPVYLLESLLGITIMLMVLLMWRAGRTLRSSGARSFAEAGRRRDGIAAVLGLKGTYFDPVAGRDVPWRAQRTAAGGAVFALIGLMGGMFGIGAGWANVPALNLLLGVPLRAAVATSGVLMAIVNTSAAWIYLDRGAVIPMITVPSLIGIMLGAKIGGRLLLRVRTAVLHQVVLAVLLLAGMRALFVGLWMAP